MLSNFVLLFIALNFINVVFATANKIITIKGGVWLAALTSGGYFGFYNIVMIYTVSDGIPLWGKVLITCICNCLGVFIVKKIEFKLKKDTLWKIETSIRNQYLETVIKRLKELDIPFNVVSTSDIRWNSINIYSTDRITSSKVKEVLKECEAKYFVTESKYF